MSGIKAVFGGGGIGRSIEGSDVETLLEIIEKSGCKNIDTATLYGDSQKLLGQAGAPNRFVIDTKMKGGFGGNGYASKENILREADESKSLLKTDSVDIYYLHGPDEGTPIEQTMEGINEVYKKGFFKRFGLSNYKAEDVQKVYDVCKAKGYVLPSVYQGNYNAVARSQETVLFPTLRKLNMSFYAYSPIAGGFLTKTKQEVESGEGLAGRFNPTAALGPMYRDMYARKSLLEALGKWENIAKDEGVSRAELAYRWVTYNSPLKRENGDAIIVGARTLDQARETLQYVQNGPLSEKSVKAIDELWTTIEHEAPLDNYHR